jgi:hypothetical protein
MRTSRAASGTAANNAATRNSAQETLPICGMRGMARNAAPAVQNSASANTRDANDLRSQPNLCSPGGPPATHALKNASFSMKRPTTVRATNALQRATLTVVGDACISAQANVKMTGPPTLAAKPPPAVVGPCRLTCYACGLPRNSGDKDTGAMAPREAKGACFFVMFARPDRGRTARC